MLELHKIQHIAVSIVGALVFTSATILAAAAPAEVGPSAAYASVQVETPARG